MDDEAYAREVAARIAAERAALLATARAEAEKRGKELFSLSALEALAYTGYKGDIESVEKRHRRFEEMYYVTFPELMTIAELAETVREINLWA